MNKRPLPGGPVDAERIWRELELQRLFELRLAAERERKTVKQERPRPPRKPTQREEFDR
jgi:hypothetical protein